MSEIAVRANASKFYEVEKNSPKNFRIRDLTNVVLLDEISARRTGEESNSFLSACMKGKSPFSISDRLPATNKQESSKTRNKSSEPSLLETLSANRSSFIEGYRDMVEVVITMNQAKSAINRTPSVLSELSVTDKKTTHEEFEKIEMLLSEFPNAHYHEGAKPIVEKIKHEVNKVLLATREVKSGIKADLYPTIEDIRNRATQKRIRV